jgi:hypothetical protein
MVIFVTVIYAIVCAASSLSVTYVIVIFPSFLIQKVESF